MTPRFAALQEQKTYPTPSIYLFTSILQPQGGIGIVAHYHVSHINSSTIDRLVIRLNRNSTSSLFMSPPDTYWGQFEEVSKYNIHLNVFERLWAAWYAYMQNDVLATGIMSFLMHETVYFGRSLPWMIIDHIPYFNKYKIQSVCNACFMASIERKSIAHASAAKNPNSARTMELRQACTAVPFHCGAASNLVRGK